MADTAGLLTTEIAAELSRQIADGLKVEVAAGYVEMAPSDFAAKMAALGFTAVDQRREVPAEKKRKALEAVVAAMTGSVTMASISSIAGTTDPSVSLNAATRKELEKLDKESGGELTAMRQAEIAKLVAANLAVGRRLAEMSDTTSLRNSILVRLNAAIGAELANRPIEKIGAKAAHWQAKMARMVALEERMLVANESMRAACEALWPDDNGRFHLTVAKTLSRADKTDGPKKILAAAVRFGWDEESIQDLRSKFRKWRETLNRKKTDPSVLSYWLEGDDSAKACRKWMGEPYEAACKAVGLKPLEQAKATIRLLLHYY